MEKRDCCNRCEFVWAADNQNYYREPSRTKMRSLKGRLIGFSTVSTREFTAALITTGKFYSGPYELFIISPFEVHLFFIIFLGSFNVLKLN